MRKRILLALALVIAISAPWRLIGLGAEIFMVRPNAAYFTQDDSSYWQALELETRLHGLGWDVGYRPNISMGGQPVYGLTNTREHAILVDADLHWTARYRVLAHEAGHTLQPIWVDNVQADCFAEAVAAVVVRQGLREHARFMAGARWTCVGLMLAESSAIYHAAALLED